MKQKIYSREDRLFSITSMDYITHEALLLGNSGGEAESSNKEVSDCMDAWMFMSTVGWNLRIEMFHIILNIAKEVFLAQWKYWILHVLNYTGVVMCILIVGKLLKGCASVRLQRSCCWLSESCPILTESVFVHVLYLRMGIGTIICMVTRLLWLFFNQFYLVH